MKHSGKKEKIISWDLYALALIFFYALLQLFRLPILPQFMDIYYHILSAQNFLHSHGYPVWDSWQYAPVGRPHIYPPLFHIILAALVKCGLSAIALAKFFEAASPVALLAVFWLFLRRNYHERLAFFGVVAFGSSLSFYMSLLNHVPATIAMILGVISVDQLLHKRLIRATIMLALSFCTHLGIPWAFLLSVFFLGLMDKERRQDALLLALFSLILSSPLLLQEAFSVKYVSVLGFGLRENRSIGFKVLEYLLGFCGLLLAFKRGGEYKFFPAFFLGSLILLVYPYRFFSAEGYFAVAMLAALGLDWLFSVLTAKARLLAYSVIAALLFAEISSPVFPASSPGKPLYFNSAFSGMLFAKGDSMWSSKEYAVAAEAIRNNSARGDIVYSTLNPAGMSLAAIAGRPTANALFVEIGPAQDFDRIAASKIIVFPSDEDPVSVGKSVRKYGLRIIGRTRVFIIYSNPSPRLIRNPQQ